MVFCVHDLLPPYIPGQQASEEQFFAALNRLRLRKRPGQEHRYSYAGDALIILLLKQLIHRDPFEFLESEYFTGCNVYGSLSGRKVSMQMESLFY